MRSRALQFLGALVGAGVCAESWRHGVPLTVAGFVVCTGLVIDAFLDDWRPRP